MDEPPLKPSGKNYGLSLFMSYAVHIPRGIDGFYSRLLFFYIYIRIERSWDEWALGHTATSRKVVGKEECTRQSRKVVWDMINTPFLTLWLSNLLLLLSFRTRKHTSMASCHSFRELKTQTHNTFRDCRVHFFRQPSSK